MPIGYIIISLYNTPFVFYYYYCIKYYYYYGRNGGTIKSTRCRLAHRTCGTHQWVGECAGRLISEFTIIILFTFPDSSWSIVNNIHHCLNNNGRWTRGLNSAVPYWQHECMILPDINAASNPLLSRRLHVCVCVKFCYYIIILL